MAFCTQCGTQNPESENFCSECGTSLRPAAAPPMPAYSAPAPMPPHPVAYPMPPYTAAPPKKKPFIWLVLAAMIILAAGGIGYYLYSNGNGAITLPDGSRYVGNYKNRLPHGAGVLSDKDGTKYEGQFREGKLNGSGTMTMPNGTVYTGDFKDGKADGQGTMNETDGTVMKGEFRNGVPHGSTMIIRPNEAFIFEQQYAHGEKIGQRITNAPFVINNITLANTTKDKKVLQDNTTQFTRQSIRYITYRLEAVSIFPRAVQGEMTVVYRYPNGQINRNAGSSPPGATFAEKINLGSEGTLQKFDRGWGNDTVSTYDIGRHKIEFWWKGVKVNEIAFDVI